jgi:hypothetical protein
MLLALPFALHAAVTRPPGPPTPPYNPGGPTRAFSRSKWETGTFSPRRIPAYKNCTLTFTADFKLPFFIKVGYNTPVMGDLTASTKRTAQLPPQDPGEFPVSVSYDGKNWQEIAHLIVDPPKAAPATSPLTPAGDDPAQVALGIFIGIGIAAVAFGLGLGAWRLYVREQRKRRQRRSDDGVRYLDDR